MSRVSDNLRRTRSDMLGADDEAHYHDCHDAADEIERLTRALADAREVANRWAAQVPESGYVVEPSGDA